MVFRTLLASLLNRREKAQEKAFFERLADIDLRWIRRIQLSDSYDGLTTCSDGWTWCLIIYKDRVVSESRVFKACGSTEHRSPGDEFWEGASQISRLYLEIVEIARTKYFRCNPPEEKNWNQVLLGDETLGGLQSHPQLQGAMKDFGLVFEPVDEHHKRIMVTKIRADGRIVLGRRAKKPRRPFLS